MVTELQIQAIKYLIRKSPDANDLAKKLTGLLINKSEGFTKAVHITLIESAELSKEELQGVYQGFHDMRSSPLHTHLPEVLVAAGIDMKFSHLYGHYGDNGEFEGMDTRGDSDQKKPLAYTFWLAKETHARDKGEEIVFSREELLSVDLTREGLYAEFEK